MLVIGAAEQRFSVQTQTIFDNRHSAQLTYGTPNRTVGASRVVNYSYLFDVY